MPWDMLRSQSAVDTLLTIMLLVWLGASAVMTLLAGQAARRHAEQGRGRRRQSAASASSAEAQAVQTQVTRSRRS